MAKRFKGMKFKDTNFYNWYLEQQQIKRDIAILEQFRFSDDFWMDCTPVPISEMKINDSRKKN